MPKKRPTPDHADGVLSGSPNWVRAVAWVGFPAALAAFLIWFLTNVEGKQLERVESLLNSQTSALAMLNEHIRADAERNAMLVGIAQRICLNTAKEADKMACVIAGTAK